MSFGVIAASVAVASAIGSTYMSIQGQKASVKAQEQAAKYNANQAKQQAKYQEDLAIENMRRKRENNKRAIARQRAMGARSGLKESGAVGAMLVDEAERLQTDVEDIWKQASDRSRTLEKEANMGIWESKQAKTASKYSIYGTALSGISSAASAGVDLSGALSTNQASSVSSQLTTSSK